MTWDYRVLVKRDDSDNPHYGIHEVYYDDKGEISSCTILPCGPYGATAEELKDNLVQMLSCTLQNTVEYDEIGWDDNMFREEEEEFFEQPDKLQEIRKIVNDLYRTSYLDHYAKKKILEAIDGTI